MALSGWTDTRLTRLFDRYRKRYWPASRRLKTYRIQASSLAGMTYGRCDRAARLLYVDATHHPSHREVRATVLHEMIHAVLARDGHRALFWTELEYLLSRRAPITPGFPELGEHGSHLAVIPSRFRRCRRLFRPSYERWQRAIARLPGQPTTLTPRGIEVECEGMALQGEEWRAIWGHQARTYGFVTLDGHVLPWAKTYHRAARRGFTRGRKSFLKEERIMAGLPPDLVVR